MADEGVAWELRDLRRTDDPDLVVKILVPPTLALEALVHESSLPAVTSLGPIVYAPNASPVGPVDLQASNGSVAVRLPRLRGTLSARCGLGRVDVTLQEPGSRGELRMLVGRGHASLRLPDPEGAHLDVAGPLEHTTLPETTGSPSAPLSCELRVGTGPLRVAATGP